ncbi:MAG: recombinase RecA [Omnitrophica bacterium RIFCSPLOWO2_12_FULL_44_17]|uniref:Protein RecA n=1 Tax=Candidatus Danuiimicrobium aquiferis TaxID=1801832 RepID=A0A1G1KYM7_9BACT|nr:MAG: recombinase RecA [Omnitrophica bacterium RIFCSPHIGHO2_02_FULL_45_28]OGW90232.1 MAG: recombinase RecA [Omnitrophica bacterium RIFCSPHIGHO2_12_FULL_44_12]OGW97981.1 MAG: recombinase RecA [Omnitrophica bacterium RIFCSPLOWO2_12_FULL_44_17]OGX03575.1 MAG: recombinase RecA [Omnitrophica bacterium RIFCSPLOWO2_02_FULL_44_11]
MTIKKKTETKEQPTSKASIEKQKALELTLQQIEKQFGKGAIMTLGQDVSKDWEAISTGALSLDIITGIGGIPRGRIVEIYGPEGSGKTTLTLSVLSQVQKKGGVAAFIDAEHALDPTYAKKLGVKLEEILISQPDSGEQALQIVEMLVRSNAIDLIVVDSVAALTPRAEIEGEMGDAHMGLQARLMSQALRKLTSIASRSKTCIIFINQLRQKIGIVFGNPETTPGGTALKFYSSMRLDIRKIASIKKGEDIIGNRVKVKVVKNKCAAPFKTCEFDIMFDEGISRSSSILDMALQYEILEKSGTWITYGPEKLGQGREAVRYFLKENPNLLDEIEAKVKERLVTDLAAGIDITRRPEVEAESKK